MERPQTVVDLLMSAAARRGSATYIQFEGREYTFQQTLDRALTSAASLLDRGTTRQCRVVVLAHNCPEFLFLWMGLAAVGAILTPGNPDATPGEIGRLVERSRPKMVVADEHAWVNANVACADGATPVFPLEQFQHGAGRAVLSAPMAPDPDDIVAAISTSGTTSAPKLVLQTHRAYTLTAEAFPAWLGLTSDDCLLAAMPLFHTNALVYSSLGALACGGRLALLPRFSAGRFWDEVREHGATQLNTVGPLLEILMRQPKRGDDADNPLRIAYTAPAPGEARHREIERRFGISLISGFGMSESLFGTIWPIDEPPRYGSMGRPRQHPIDGEINHARVVDEDGNDVPTGQRGELLLRNPTVMRGYFDMAEETEQALRDGWLHTGDLVRVDSDGFFYHLGRTKEMIRRRGENISPAEIEEVLREHPEVQDASVLGIPSDLSEEDIVAFVVPANSRPVDEHDLAEWCSTHLSRSKIPERFLTVGSLPLTPTGRVAKHLLKESAMSRATSSSAHEQLVVPD